MRLEIDREDVQSYAVDRDSVENDYGHEGFDISFGQCLLIHFEDEEDAAVIARAILDRLGELERPRGPQVRRRGWFGRFMGAVVGEAP